MPLIASRATASSRAYGFSNFVAKPFSGTISTNQTNLNLRTYALANGWDGFGAVTVTINAGVYVYSTTTGGYALTVSGSFPGGVSLVNNGTILGAGGYGGTGASAAPGSSGASGASGGPALVVSSAISITNNGSISGGGGGGGGGGAYEDTTVKGGQWYAGGGGGGGIGNGAGGFGGSGNGGSGTLTSAGSGGFSYFGTGGAGGGYGSSGAGGVSQTTSGGGGGAGGACLSGNSFITWLAFGTRNGTIT